MIKRHISSAALALLATGLVGTEAMAGGLERGGYNIDLLFDPSAVTAEGSTVYVMPDRKLKNAKDVDPSDGLGSNGFGGGTTTAKDTENYWNSRVGIKAAIGSEADCLVDYSQPWGAHSKPGANWVGAQSNIETKIKSENYGLTCSYRFDAGPGQIRVIGGGFYQEVSGFKDRLVVPDALTPFGNGVGHLELKGDGWGWRAGLAYEIPEYAFRASLVYNSEVKLDNITGKLDLSQVNGANYNVYGSQAMPDSVELKVQSGIAPDWLAFGSVKWVDWSQFQQIPFYIKGTNIAITQLDLGYRDGVTVVAGVGHKFTDQWSGAVSLSWDRGTSQGYGAQTDTWAVGAAVSYAPTKNVEFRLAGLVGLLTSGKSGTVVIDGKTYGDDATYSFGNDVVTALNANLKVKF
ncbi:OmpP1/FadL family transporter [Allorhizobium taibaishanense]|uniref:Long-chain fatty acid transport protein n=1 Tax=Allorhizobium taibaishanense TaxID=887144 RepID=A0A1Q9A362_9HYPH|nr:OmpP1/FadL family transporter [Allorhizobium taibaishanense]MBB4006036.1 long-chain fatty acid transport protein [Allorhizobium taibaishanense]OLP49053.1 long-chain fatty acid transporter [Allorhizobium taibaishanense]